MTSPTDHRGHIGKVLHGCTLHSFRYTKAQKVSLKFYNILVIWCAQSDHFRPLFCTTLKSLTNYSAAMKSVIRKISYNYSHRTNMLLLTFFYPLKWSKSCAQTLPVEFSEKKSNFDLILRQMWRHLAV